jgi:hypothetical protein
MSPFTYISASQPASRKIPLGVPREIVEYIDITFKTPRQIQKIPCRAGLSERGARLRSLWRASKIYCVEQKKKKKKKKKKKNF